MYNDMFAPEYTPKTPVSLAIGDICQLLIRLSVCSKIKKNAGPRLSQTHNDEEQ